MKSNVDTYFFYRNDGNGEAINHGDMRVLLTINLIIGGDRILYMKYKG